MPLLGSTLRDRRAGPASRLRRHAARALPTLAVLFVFLAVASGSLHLMLDVGVSSGALARVAATREFAVLAGVGVVMAVLLPVLSPIAGSILTFLCMLPVYWLSFQETGRLLVPMEYSLLTILALFVVHLMLSFVREAKQKQQVIDLFGQYVPPALAARLGRDPSTQDLTGESRELTVMFCDVKNFTGHAERMRPGDLSALLNALLTPLTEVVHRHHGTIDKYMGDALMAFWGAPLADPHHAGNAVAAAFEMQAAVARLADEFAARDWPVLEVGIGINSGLAHVGNMGSRYRIAYTAIGDSVNLASRLESLTRLFHTGIIVGENTRNAFPAATYRELGLVQVKGKQDVARIYEPLQPGLDPASTAVVRLELHNQGLAAYYRRDWNGAVEAFTTLHERYPHDPLYGYYLDRIAGFRIQAPPDDWRGELRFSVN